MKIKVTEDDIRNGTPCDASSCPVAIAMKRQLDIAETIWVGSFNFKLGHKSIKWPNSVTDFIYNFDRNIPVKPFTVELNLEK